MSVGIYRMRIVAAAVLSMISVKSQDFGSPIMLSMTAFPGEVPKICSGDMDGDGDSDVVVSNTLFGVAWLEQSSGLWVLHEVERRSGVHDIDVRDMDGDGDLDILTVSSGGVGWPGSCCGGDVRVLWNDGAGVFAPQVITQQVNGGRAIVASDLDGDSRMDVVWTSLTSSPNLMAVLGVGAGGFGPVVSIGSVGDAHDLSVVDGDGDGRLDIMVGRHQGMQPYLFIQPLPGTGSWQAQPLPGLHRGSRYIFSGDFDADGLVDVLSQSLWAPHDVYVRFGLNPGVFDAGSVVASGVVGRLCMLDADVDGDEDVLCVSGGRLSVIENDGGHFLSVRDLVVPVGVGVNTHIFAGDVDQDGDVDALLFDVSTSRVTLSLNQGSDLDALYRTYGQSCSARPSGLVNSAGLYPVMGAQFRVDINTSGVSQAVVLMTGLSNRSYLGSALPMSLDTLGAEGCEVKVSPDFATPLQSSASGIAQWQASLPNSPSSLGQVFFQQAVVLDPSANALGLSFTNAGVGRIGR